MMSGPQFNPPQSTGLSGLGTMLESSQDTTEAKTILKFKDALLMIWSTNAINSAVKYYHK